MDKGRDCYDRFLNGDDTGMEALITEYCDGLVFYLYKIVGSIEMAEELAEDTFVLLCTKKPRDRKKSSFKTWLYTIGRNIAIDRLRHNAKRQTVSIDVHDDISDKQDTPEEKYISDSRKITVNRALKGLKSDYRQVLWLFYFEDMSYKEISVIMKRSEHATQMLAVRAREALKSELLKEGLTNEDY